jgi:glycosyltransferase involved in cell wall biosynthesis
VRSAVTVDIAGAHVGGAARLAAELQWYLARSRRDDVTVIGAGRKVDPAWLVHREVTEAATGHRIAFNNVGFLTPGGDRCTLLQNALHFLTDAEQFMLGPSLTTTDRWKAAMVRLTALRADVLVTPSTCMAERVARAMPRLRTRIVVRPHPVSPGLIPRLPKEPAILCPVLFAPYKQMTARIAEWINAVDGHIDSSIRLIVTAKPAEMPAELVRHPQVQLAGRVSQAAMRRLWASSRAIYFPTTVESFGFPLAEARANGFPVIAASTPQNREIAGPALCGFTPGDPASLCRATQLALSTDITADPAPFDPDDYFGWLLGGAR